MHASQVMTREVIKVHPITPVSEIIELLIRHRISGLPVVDESEHVVGIISKRDLLHRIEDEPDQAATPWLRRIFSPRADPDHFIKAHGRRAADLMTPRPIMVEEDTPLYRVAQTLERHHISRVPVALQGRLRGIITRSNLLHGLAAMHQRLQPCCGHSDMEIRQTITSELRQRFDISDNSTNVVVCNGEVDLWGIVASDSLIKAAGILAEETDGVTSVRNHLRVLSHLLNPE